MVDVVVYMVTAFSFVMYASFSVALLYFAIAMPFCALAWLVARCVRGIKGWR